MSNTNDKITASALRWGISGINYRRARSRALTRLSNKYKDEYLVLLEEEKAKDVAEGKNWTTILNDSSDYMGDTPDQTQQNRATTGEEAGEHE